MLNKRNGFVMSATALAIVLTGCGSGGSGTNADPGTSGHGPVQTSALDALISTQTRNEKAPADRSAPISSTGVRGDVLRTMLEQRTCHGHLLPTTGLYKPFVARDKDDIIPVRAEADLRPDSYLENPNPGMPMPSTPHFPVNCSVFRLFQLAPTGEYLLRARSLAFFEGQTTDYVKRGVSAVYSDIPFSATTESITLGETIDTNTHPDQGHRYNPPQPNGPQKEQLKLKAVKPLTIRHNTHVGYGELITWTQGDKFQRILVLPGLSSKQAKVCWHTNLELVKRLHCKVWNLPENWKPGQKLKSEDQYVIDDRSIYPNEKGLNYWHQKRYGG